MSKASKEVSDLAIAPAESPIRKDFKWEAPSASGSVTITRSSKSGPMPIQANN
jgi:hypothetical protein